MKWYLQVFKNYAKFEGRARRKEYWYFALFNNLAIILIVAIQAVLSTTLSNSAFAVLSWLMPTYFLIALIPALAVSVRRMHDVGKSGWYMFIPIYGLILSLTDGESGRNRYGTNPKDEYNDKSGLSLDGHMTDGSAY